MERPFHSDANYELDEQPITYSESVECLKYVQDQQAMNEKGASSNSKKRSYFFSNE